MQLFDSLNLPIDNVTDMNIAYSISNLIFLTYDDLISKYYFKNFNLTSETILYEWIK